MSSYRFASKGPLALQLETPQTYIEQADISVNHFAALINRSCPHTENEGTIPTALSAHALDTTERTNAVLPSKVLGEPGDHRCRPIRLPTIEAYGEQSVPSSH
jgi:hypothetical protein